MDRSIRLPSQQSPLVPFEPFVACSSHRLHNAAFCVVEVLYSEERDRMDLLHNARDQERRENTLAEDCNRSEGELFPLEVSGRKKSLVFFAIKAQVVNFSH